MGLMSRPCGETRGGAADLQNNVRDINGRYDYLLNAWYARSFELPKGIGLRVTGGIIDSTDFLDDNAYSNDEYTQFMNEALVNGPQSFPLSYDVGGLSNWTSAPGWPGAW